MHFCIRQMSLRILVTFLHLIRFGIILVRRKARVWIDWSAPPLTARPRARADIRMSEKDKAPTGFVNLPTPERQTAAESRGATSQDEQGSPSDKRML